MRPGGKIVGFHLNPSLAPLPANDPGLVVALSRLIDPVRVHYAGSPESARLLRAIQRAAAGGGHEFTRAARIVLAQLRVLPQTLAINRAEAAMTTGQLGPARPVHQHHPRGHHRRASQARPLQPPPDQTLTAAGPA